MSDYERLYLLVSSTEEGTVYDSLIVLYNSSVDQPPEWIRLGETGNELAQEHFDRLMKMEDKNMYELISSGKVQFIDKKHQRKIQFLLNIFGTDLLENSRSLIFDQTCLASTYLFGRPGMPFPITFLSNASVLFLPVLWLKSVFDLGVNMRELRARNHEEEIGKRKGYDYSYLNLKKSMLIFLYTTTFINLMNVSTQYVDILKKVPDMIFAKIESMLLDSDKTQFNDETLSTEIETIIERALEKNRFLNEEDKEIVADSFPILTENPYLDIRQAYRRMRVLSIQDHEESHRIYPAAAGEYFSWYSSINTYHCETIASSAREKIVHHAVVHLSGSFYCSCLDEGLNTLLLEEYMQEYISYKDCGIICKMLCEIVGPDLMLEAYSRGTHSLITKKLEQIDSTIDPCHFFEQLDDAHTVLYIDQDGDAENYNQLKKANVQTLLTYAEKAQLSEESYGTVLSYAEYLLGVSDTLPKKRYFSKENQEAMKEAESGKVFTKK